MTWVDWAIVIALVLSVLGGFSQGFFRSVCSLGGLFLGLAAAAWNYPRVASFFSPFIRIQAISDAVGFILIALVVMALANLVGAIVAKTLHQMGLGCLDKLAGGVFGFFQGALLVTLCILVTVAFFPAAHWLVQSRLPRLFFGACHLSTQMSPAELADRVRATLWELEQQSPQWLHPGKS